MPPPLLFPIVWTSMAVLRTTASVLVFDAVGATLLAPPLIVFMLHLCIGDTWNTINNAEQRLGLAVPGVLFCLGSACAATAGYAAVAPLAGRVLAPLCVWLTVASALVFDIWRLNNVPRGRYPLYPTK
jgi:benzodiazapine receptor